MEATRVRLVGCALPPLATAGAAREPEPPTLAAAMGAATLSVPHVLASAAAQRRQLPEAVLVRLRWGHEPRGSLFRPAPLAMESSRSNGAPTPTVEMVYPISVDAPRFVAYLRQLKELTLDVLDRSTRRQIGRCTVPLFCSSPRRRSNLPSPLQEAAAADATVETTLRQIRRENALYEIKAVESDEEDGGDGDGGDDATIGYLVVNLDVQFRDSSSDDRDALDGELVVTSTWLKEPLVDSEKRAPAVLIPRASPSVRVHVQHSLGRVSSNENAQRGERHRPFEVDASLSPISLLDSDTSSSFRESTPVRGDSHLPIHISKHENAIRTAPSSTPPDPSKLLELIEKGKMLQESMAKAVDDDEPSGRLDYLQTIGVKGDLSSQVLMLRALDDSSASVSEDDPSSWQSILKRPQSPLQDSSQTKRPPSPKSGTSPQVSDVQGLKISFDSIGFTREFASQLQQLRDSSISSRFNPVEVAVTHSDIAALLGKPKDKAGEINDGEPLFSFTPSLQRRAFRLSYSHVIPLPTRIHFLSQQAMQDSNKKQLEFSVVCKTQGTPRRNRQASRGGRSFQISLRGLVDVCDVFSSQESTTEPQLVKVYLSVCEDNGFAHEAGRRAGEVVQRVGVLKVRFQVCTMKTFGNDLKDDGRDRQLLESSLRLSSRDSIAADSSESPSSACEANRHSSITRVSSRSPHNGKMQKGPKRIPQVTMQLGVMIDRATSIALSDTQTTNGWCGTSFVRFQYIVPHSKAAAGVHPAGTFKRSFKRKLVRVGGEQNPSRRFSANVGHIGVFPFEMELLSNHYSEIKLLIIEVWLQREQDTRDRDGALLGLVKVPLSVLFSRIRESRKYGWDQPLPAVGVDDRFAIIDPFSGQTSGFIHTRVAVGTAEQMMSLSTALRGIVQLQAMARGFISRRIHFGRVRRVDGKHNANAAVHSDQTAQSLEASSGEADGASFQVEAARNEERHHGSVDASIALAETTNSQQVVDGESSLNVVLWHEIGLEIFECWQSVNPHPVPEQRKRRSVLGCDVEGELVLHDDRDESPAEQSVVSFALWWDASHARLNSSFEHSFRSRQRGDASDLASEVSEVNLRFRVQKDFLGSSGADAQQGHAKLSLRDILEGVAASENRFLAKDRRNQLVYCEKKFNVPIEWQGDSLSPLTPVFPVRVWYRVVARSSAVPRPFEPALSTGSSYALDDTKLKGSGNETNFPDLLVGREAESIPATAPDEPKPRMVEILPKEREELLQVVDFSGYQRHNSDHLLGPDEKSPFASVDGTPLDLSADAFLSVFPRSSSHSSSSKETPELQHRVLDHDEINPDCEEVPRCQEAEDCDSVPESMENDTMNALDQRIELCEESAEYSPQMSGATGFDVASELAEHEEQKRPTDSRLEIDDLSFASPGESTDFYPPITLSSFGIEEIQLSPSRGSASSQGIMSSRESRTPTAHDDYDSSTISQLEEREAEHESGNEHSAAPSEKSLDEPHDVSTRDNESQASRDSITSEADVSSIPDVDAREDELESSVYPTVSTTQDARVQTDLVENEPAVVALETRRLMVDAACGTSDDGGDDDDIVDLVSEDACEVNAAEGESSYDAKGIASPQEVDETEEVQQPVHSPSKEDDEGHVQNSPAREKLESTPFPMSKAETTSGSPLALSPQHSEAAFSLPVDKFEIICQLLTDIRDSCGAERVREIIAAHTAQLALLDRKVEKSAVDLVDTESRCERDDELVNEQEAVVSAADDNHTQTKPQQQLSPFPGSKKRDSPVQLAATSRLANVANVSLLDPAEVYCTVNRQHVPALAPSGVTTQEHPVFSSTPSSSADTESFRRRRCDAEVTAESASLHRSRVQSLKPLRSIDSHTLQQEMQRRLERSGMEADRRDGLSNSRVSVTATSLPRVEPLSCLCHEEKLFPDTVNSPMYALRSRPKQKLLSYKADTETERIARIMQGSVDYWRKGDDHAITSCDDSADSDMDDDLYF